ncbi:MAG: hypothetical protein LDL23_12185 [Flavobacterium sp.]|uniref:hypothetical protein n=1 Tax=Flavobacterium sp. TaxID=239 RepID=UPI0025B9025B|nr:hypothetical protein [Flavobacterium sp.]MCA1967389.1 hypothetical protein [Flavobacterium sp.]
MKKIILLFLLSLIMINCESKINRDLKIPNKVISKNDENDLQFDGTRISIKKPNDFEYIQKLLRIQKNPSTYIQVMEIENSSFTESKKSILKNYENDIASGKLPKEFYKKEFFINEYEAILYYVADKRNHSEQIALSFGDNEFSAIAFAVFPENDIKTREEIIKTLFSISFDKKKEANSNNLQNFNIDLKNTEFINAGNMSQLFVYNLSGKIDANNLFDNQIIIGVLPKFDNKESLKNYSLDMINRHKSSGIEISKISEKEIELKDGFGYEIYFEGKYQGKYNSVYQITIGNKNSSLIFSGVVYDRRDELMQQIKLIAKTLKLK